MLQAYRTLQDKINILKKSYYLFDDYNDFLHNENGYFEVLMDLRILFYNTLMCHITKMYFKRQLWSVKHSAKDFYFGTEKCKKERKTYA